MEWIKDEAVWWREVGAGGKEHISNSSHLERLMDGAQHFCAHPGSLPPHSITRQSIKSSKREKKKKKQIGICYWSRRLMQLSVALSQPDVCRFCAGLF